MLSQEILDYERKWMRQEVIKRRRDFWIGLGCTTLAVVAGNALIWAVVLGVAYANRP